MLLSTLSTSVTCGPLWPGSARTSRVSPGSTVLMPLWASTLPWRKASPDPSESSTKPNPFSGLNHLTTPLTGGPDGASNRGWLNRGRVPKARGVVGRNQRRSRDAANDENLALSLWFLGWLSDQFRGATIRSVAGLIAGVLDTIRRWFDIQSAVRGSVAKVALRAVWIKGKGGKNRVGIVSALIGLSAAFEQIGRAIPRYGVRCSEAPTRGVGSSSRTWKTPPVLSTL